MIRNERIGTLSGSVIGVGYLKVLALQISLFQITQELHELLLL